MDIWANHKLGEVCLKIGSGATPRGGKEAYKDSGISLIRSQNVLDFSFSDTGLAFIDEGQARQLDNVTVEQADVLINITGDSVARVCMAPSEYLPARVNQHVSIVRVIPELADPYFILYLLQYKKQHLLSIGSSGGTRNALTKGMLEQLEIKLPPLAVQANIGRVLGSLDEKIENNTKINHNLEQQAQAIFKSWFVDFEPFEGEQPASWITGKAEDFFDIAIGKTPPRKEPEWFTANPQDVVWVSISDMGKCGMFISDSSEYLTPESVARFNVKVASSGTVLLSFKLTVGRVAIADGEMATNEAIAHFMQSSDETLEYLYCYLKAFDYQSLGNTSSIATAVNSKTIKAMPFIMPDTKALDDFHTITAPLFEQVRKNLSENARLAALRDTLLPKLMSGELSVTDI